VHRMRDRDYDLESDLVDLTGIDLDRIRALPDSAFGAALRRVLDEARTDTERYAGFQNNMAASTDPAER
jgi:FXSXX-COOH protein